MVGPLGRISLGLSGGGTRAAGYHLGVLHYLDRMGLLQDVAVISGASGGGFITSTYAMGQAKGWSFEQYHSWMLEKLRSGRMAEWVLDRFTRGTPQGHAGRRTVIGALAQAYDEHFFQGFRFGEFLRPGPNGSMGKVGHLEEVIINATDFRSGLGFRFQLNEPAGNGQAPISPMLLRHARLADVMASSSCLPGGMEPIFFPEDFAWVGEEAESDRLALTRAFSHLGVESIPLMDGGLYDNQGLESLMQAATRIDIVDGDSAPDPGLAVEQRVFRSTSESQRFVGEFDLLFQQLAAGKVPKDPPGALIVSDAVAEADPILRSAYRPGQELPLRTTPQPPEQGWRLASVTWVFVLLLVLCGVTAGAVLIDLVIRVRDAGYELTTLLANEGLAAILFMNVVPGLLALAVLFALYHARSAAHAMAAAVDVILETEGRRAHETRKAPSTWSFLRHLRVRQIPWLIHTRLSSIMAVLNDLFFVRHRILGYALLYGFPGWRRQLLSVEIFSLDVDPPADAPPVTPAMQNVGRKAADQPTAFWYDEPHQLEELVATGQMCMCRNLIVFLRRRLAEGTAPDRAAFEALLARAEADWQRMSLDPLVLVPKAARPSVAIGAVTS